MSNIRTAENASYSVGMSQGVFTSRVLPIFSMEFS
jgi:hypothetical protein